MLTVRLLGPEDAGLAVDPLVAPSEFARSQDPPDLRAYTVWSGSDEALQILGLQRGTQAKEEQIAAAIAGLHADSGEQVREGHAWDLTLLAPDSLSRLWTRAPFEVRVQLEQALLNAAENSVRHLVHSRSMADGTEPGRGCALALALHATGEPFYEVPLPLLHVHVYLVGILDGSGALRGPRTLAMFEKSLSREGRAVGRVVLAKDLHDLGYTLVAPDRDPARGFEIAGLPEFLLPEGQAEAKGCAGLGEETDADPWDEPHSTLGRLWGRLRRRP